MPPDSTSVQIVGAVLPPRADGAALLGAGVDMAYQPIVHLGSGAVIAYEALCRPRHAATPNPTDFFAALEADGLRLAGERLAIRSALAGLDGGISRAKLFVNASPLMLVDPDFDEVELAEMLDAHCFARSDLVIEVTESEAVDDLDALAQRARRLARLGIAVAVDDAGAGHASFRVITRLRPAYIKLDRDLVTGVETDGARHAFIEAMVRFSRQIGSRLVAEGIETRAELSSLAGLGVEAGQGYYLARPQTGAFVRPTTEARRAIGLAAQRLRVGAAKVSVGELAEPVVLIDPRTPIRAVYDRFVMEPTLGVLAIARPEAHGEAALVSQLSRGSLERAMSKPGAWERLADEPVEAVAEHQPLIVPAEADIREVGAIIAAREAQALTGDILVAERGGAMVGTVRLRDVLHALTDTARSRDEDLHPLSGLPGAAWVERELARRLGTGAAATVAYLDVDEFRAINELGGFVLGDEVIRALARCLVGATGGIQGAAVAHVGGDDFVLLATPSSYEELVAEIVRSCEREVMPLLRTQLCLRSAEHLVEGIYLSIAAVDLLGAPPAGHRYLQWVENQLVGLQDLAKMQTGHASAHYCGGATRTSTWTPRGQGKRSISLGLADPGVVLEALAVIDGAWTRWCSQRARGEGRCDRFPGPSHDMRLLLERHLGPVARAAEAALAGGRNDVAVEIAGEEAELLSLLDRIDVVTRDAAESSTQPLPTALGFVRRLVRQRARVIVRRDVVVRDE